MAAPHTPHRPGDTVRDRATRTDYVIHSVVALTTTGAFIYTLVNVFDRSTRTISSQHVTDFERNYTVILNNTKNKSSISVLNDLRTSLQKSLDQNSKLFEDLAKPENEVLRDLLYISGDAKENTFSTKLVELAQSIVQGTSSTYDKETIKKAIKETVDTKSVSEDLIDNLVESLHTQIINTSKTAEFLEQSSTGAKLASYLKHERPIFDFLRKTTTNDLSRFERNVVGTLFERAPVVNNFGLNNPLIIAMRKAESDRARLSLLISSVVEGVTGQDMSPGLRRYIEREQGKALALVRQGKAHPLTQLALQALEIRTATAGILFRPKELDQIAAYFKPQQAAFMERYRGKFGYNAKLRYRYSMTERQYNHTLSRATIDWKATAADLRLATKASPALMVSMDKQTFYRDLVQRSGAIAQSPQAQANAVAYFKENDLVFLSANHLADVLEGSSTNTVEDLFKHSDYIKGNLDTQIINNVRANHYNIKGYANRPGIQLIQPQTRETVIDTEIKTLLRSVKDSKPQAGYQRVYSVDVDNGPRLFSTLERAVKATKQHKLSLNDIMYDDVKGDLTTLESLPKPKSIGTLNSTRKLITRARLKPLLPRRKSDSSTLADTLDSAAIAVNVVKDSMEIKVAGTTMHGSNVNQQFNLIKEFYKHKDSIIIDIETRQTKLGSNTWRLTEAAFGTADNVKNIMFSKQTKEQAIDSLLEITTAIANAPVVASQGTLDPNFLMDQINKALGQTYRNAELADAKELLENARKTKWLDLMVLHGMRTGENMSLINQQYLSAKYLGVYQTHTAVKDVQQAWTLALGAESDVLHNINNVSFNTKDKVFLGTDSLKAHYGRMYQVANTGVDPLTNEAIAQFKEIKVNSKGLLEPTGHTWVEHYENAPALAGSILQGEIIDSSNLKAQILKYQQINQDITAREIREALNPLSKTLADPLKIFKDPTQNIHGAFTKYRAKAIAKTHFEDLASELTADVGGFDLYKVSTKLANRVAESESIETQQYVAYYLRQMQTNVGFKAELTGGGLGEFIDSPFGRQMFELSNVDGHMPLMFTLGTIDHLGASAHKPEISKPRLSVSLGRSTVSLEYSDNGRTITSNANKLNSLASEFILESTRDIDGAGHGQLFTELGFDSQKVYKAVENLRTKAGVDDYDIVGWKDLMGVISHSDDPDARLLNRVQKRILTDPIAMRRALVLSLDSHMKNIAGTLDADSKIAILQNIRENIAKGKGNVIPNMQSAMSEALANEGNFDFLKTTYQDVDFSKFTELSNQDVAEILHSTQDILHSYTGNADFSAQVQAGVESAKAQGLTGLLAQQEVYNTIKAGAKNTNAVVDKLAETGTTVAGTTGNSSVAALHTQVQKAVDATVENSFESKAAIHELILSTSKTQPNVTNLSTPLLVVGGVLGLMAAFEPTSDGFSQGKRSRALGMSAPYSALFAEIPGSENPTETWQGDTAPFRLDITFNGFVKSKEQQDQLFREVYNSVNGHMEVHATNTAVEDARSNHRMEARKRRRRI